MVLPLLLLAFVVWLIIKNRLQSYIGLALGNTGGASGSF